MHAEHQIALLLSLILITPVHAQPGKDGPGRKHEPPVKHNQLSHAGSKAALPGGSLGKGIGKSQHPGNFHDQEKNKRNSLDQSSQNRSHLSSKDSQATLRPSEKKSKPALSDTQQKNLEKLAKDLQGLKAGSQVTPEMVTQLKDDMLAMCDNANKPSQESVQKLSQDLGAALSDKTLSNKEKAQLSKDLQTVMTSANLNPEEVQAVLKDIQAILTASNVSKDDAEVIKSDVQAIISELQKNATAK